MITDLIDDTEKKMDKENLSNLGKSKIKISTLFYEFIDFMSDKNIGIRMESLIENLKEFRASDYT